MNFNIRQATINDARAICQLLAEGGKLHVQALPTLLKPPQISTTEKFVNDLLRDEKSHIWVAEVNQKVVGYLHFNHREEKEHPVKVPRSYISVSSLIVEEPNRQQGIGKAFMQRLHEWPKNTMLMTSNCKFMNLTHLLWAFTKSWAIRQFHGA